MAVYIVVTNTGTGAAIVIDNERLQAAILDLQGDGHFEDLEATLAVSAE